MNNIVELVKGSGIEPSKVTDIYATDNVIRVYSELLGTGVELPHNGIRSADISPFYIFINLCHLTLRFEGLENSEMELTPSQVLKAFKTNKVSLEQKLGGLSTLTIYINHAPLEVIDGGTTGDDLSDDNTWHNLLGHRGTNQDDEYEEDDEYEDDEYDDAEYGDDDEYEDDEYEDDEYGDDDEYEDDEYEDDDAEYGDDDEYGGDEYEDEQVATSKEQEVQSTMPKEKVDVSPSPSKVIQPTNRLLSIKTQLEKYNPQTLSASEKQTFKDFMMVNRLPDSPWNMNNNADNFIFVIRDEFCYTYVGQFKYSTSKFVKAVDSLCVDFMKMQKASFSASWKGVPSLWGLTVIHSPEKFYNSSIPGTDITTLPSLGDMHKVCVGHKPTGPVYIDMGREQHRIIMVGAGSRSGKSSLINAINLQLFACNAFIMYLDWKPSGSVPYVNLGIPIVQRETTKPRNNLDSAKGIINLFLDIYGYRNTIMTTNPSAVFEPVVFIMDELLGLYTDYNELEKDIKKEWDALVTSFGGAMRRFANANMYCIMITQDTNKIGMFEAKSPFRLLLDGSQHFILGAGNLSSNKGNEVSKVLADSEKALVQGGLGNFATTLPFLDENPGYGGYFRGFHVEEKASDPTNANHKPEYYVGNLLETMISSGKIKEINTGADILKAVEEYRVTKENCADNDSEEEETVDFDTFFNGVVDKEFTDDVDNELDDEPDIDDEDFETPIPKSTNSTRPTQQTIGNTSPPVKDAQPIKEEDDYLVMAPPAYMDPKKEYRKLYDTKTISNYSRLMGSFDTANLASSEIETIGLDLISQSSFVERPFNKALPLNQVISPRGWFMDKVSNLVSRVSPNLSERIQHSASQESKKRRNETEAFLYSISQTWNYRNIKSLAFIRKDILVNQIKYNCPTVNIDTFDYSFLNKMSALKHLVFDSPAIATEALQQLGEGESVNEFFFRIISLETVTIFNKTFTKNSAKQDTKTKDDTPVYNNPSNPVNLNTNFTETTDTTETAATVEDEITFEFTGNSVPNNNDNSVIPLQGEGLVVFNVAYVDGSYSLKTGSSNPSISEYFEDIKSTILKTYSPDKETYQILYTGNIYYLIHSNIETIEVSTISIETLLDHFNSKSAVVSEDSLKEVAYYYEKLLTGQSVSIVSEVANDIIVLYMLSKRDKPLCIANYVNSPTNMIVTFTDTKSSIYEQISSQYHISDYTLHTLLEYRPYMSDVFKQSLDKYTMVLPSPIE